MLSLAHHQDVAGDATIISDEEEQEGQAVGTRYPATIKNATTMYKGKDKSIDDTDCTSSEIEDQKSQVFSNYYPLLFMS